MLNKKSKKGFTLVEMLVVVLILGILAAMAAPSYFSTVEITKSREAIDMLRQWQGARAIYLAEDNNNIAQDSTTSNTRLQISAIGDTKDFTCTTGTVSTDSVLCTRLNNLYSIFATNNHMYCCWGAVRPAIAEKVCRNLTNEDNLAQGTLPQNSSCLELIE